MLVITNKGKKAETKKRIKMKNEEMNKLKKIGIINGRLEWNTYQNNSFHSFHYFHSLITFILFIPFINKRKEMM